MYLDLENGDLKIVKCKYFLLKFIFIISSVQCIKGILNIYFSILYFYWFCKPLKLQSVLKSELVPYAVNHWRTDYNVHHLQRESLQLKIELPPLPPLKPTSKQLQKSHAGGMGTIFQDKYIQIKLENLKVLLI